MRASLCAMILLGCSGIDSVDGGSSRDAGLDAALHDAGGGDGGAPLDAGAGDAGRHDAGPGDAGPAPSDSGTSGDGGDSGAAACAAGATVLVSNLLCDATEYVIPYMGVGQTFQVPSAGSLIGVELAARANRGIVDQALTLTVLEDGPSGTVTLGSTTLAPVWTGGGCPLSATGRGTAYFDLQRAGSSGGCIHVEPGSTYRFEVEGGNTCDGTFCTGTSQVCGPGNAGCGWAVHRTSGDVYPGGFFYPVNGMPPERTPYDLTFKLYVAP